MALGIMVVKRQRNISDRELLCLIHLSFRKLSPGSFHNINYTEPLESLREKNLTARRKSDNVFYYYLTQAGNQLLDEFLYDAKTWIQGYGPDLELLT